MESLSHKQGDTLSLLCVWTDSNGSPIDLSGYDITSKVKTFSSTPFTDTLRISVINPGAGTFSINADSAQTSLWPVTSGQYNRMYCDVQFSLRGNTIVSSDTFEIVVLKEITT